MEQIAKIEAKRNSHIPVQMHRVFVQDHPFAAAKEKHFLADMVVADIVKNSGVRPGTALVYVGGKLLYPECWGTTRIKHGAHIMVASAMGGGIGKAISKPFKNLKKWAKKHPMLANIIKIVALIGFSILTAGIGTAAVGGLGGGMIGAGWGFSAGVSSLVAGVLNAGFWMLLNVLIPPPKPVQPSRDQIDSQVYQVNAQGNNPTPYGPIIKVYGKHKFFPPQAAVPYSVWHGNRNDLYMLIDLGFDTYEYEPPAVALPTQVVGGAPNAVWPGGSLVANAVSKDSTKGSTTPYGSFGETPVSIYGTSEVYFSMIEWVPGQTASDVFKYYKNDIQGEGLGRKFALTDPITTYTAKECSEIQIDINFPSGLYSMDRDGKVHSASCRYKVEIADADTGGPGTAKFESLEGLTYRVFTNMSTDIRTPLAIFPSSYEISFMYDDTTSKTGVTHSRYAYLTDYKSVWNAELIAYVQMPPIDIVGKFFLDKDQRQFTFTGTTAVGNKVNIYEDSYIVEKIEGNKLTLKTGLNTRYAIGTMSFLTLQKHGENIGTTRTSFTQYIGGNLDKFPYYAGNYAVANEFTISASDEAQGLTFTLYITNLRKSSNPTTYTQYIVRVTNTAKWSAATESVLNDSNLSQVRTVRASIPPVNPTIPHTFLELFIQANEKFDTGIDNYNIVVTSKLPVFKEGGSVKWDDKSTWAVVPTRNPAWIFVDILTGHGNRKAVSTGELDKTSIVRWAAFCDEVLPKYNGPRYTCDFVLDFSTTIKDLLDKVCSTGRASFAMIAGKYGVLIDEIKDIPVQIFTPRNYASLTYTRNYIEQPHGMKVKWVDPLRDWQPVEELVVNDGYTLAQDRPWATGVLYYVWEVVTYLWTTGANNGQRLVYRCEVSHTSGSFPQDLDSKNWREVQIAEIFETLDTFGCTRVEQAVRFGRYYLANMKLRQDTINIDVDVEYLACSRGDRVQLVADVMRVGGLAARIVEVDKSASRIKIDDRFDFGGDPDLNFEVRGSRGIYKGSSVTVVTADNFILESFTEFAFSDIVVGDIVVIGRKDYVTFDCLVREIHPGKNMSASLTLHEYAKDIFAAADSDAIVAFDPRISPIYQDKTPVPITSVTVSESITFEARKAYSNVSVKYVIPEYTNPDVAVDETRKKNPAVYGSVVLWEAAPENNGVYKDIARLNPGENFLRKYLAGTGRKNLVTGLEYKYKLQPISVTGKSEDVSTLKEFSIILQGDTESPPEPLNLDISVIDNHVLLTWEQPVIPDLAGYVLKFSPEIDAVSWNECAPFVDYITDTSNSVKVVARVGTYMLKSIDTSGNNSKEPAVAVTSIPALANLNVVTELVPETGEWINYDNTPGASNPHYVNTYAVPYTPPPRHLLLGAAKAIKSLRRNEPRMARRRRDFSLFAAQGALGLKGDSQKGFAGVGYYVFPNNVTLDAVYTLRIQNLSKSRGRTVSPAVITWGEIGSVQSINNAKDGMWSSNIEVRLGDTVLTLAEWPTIGTAADYTPAPTPPNYYWPTDSGVAKTIAEISGNWTDWRTVFAGEYTGKIFSFRVVLESFKQDTTVLMTSGAISVDVPDRTISGYNLLTSATGMASVVFSSAFMPKYGSMVNEVALGISVDGKQVGEWYTIAEKTNKGFKIQFYKADGSAVSRVVSFDYSAKGYGRKSLYVI